MWPFVHCCTAELLLMLLLQAAPLSTVAATLLIAADAPSAAGCTKCSALQGLPLAAPLLLQLLLQIQDRAIEYSAVLPSPRLELATAPLALAN